MAPFSVRGSLICVATLITLGSAGPVRAQRTWLQPESTTVAPAAVLFLTALTSAEFATAPEPVPATRIAETKAELAGQSVPVVLLPSAGSARMLTTFAGSGIATVDVLLKPEARSVARGRVESYLRELHATDDVRAEWAKIESPNPWQEVRTLRLKAFVQVGSPANDDRVGSAPTVSGLDLLPLTDPTRCRAGKTFSVRATRDGQPLAGAVVEYLSDGEGREHVAITDRSGTAAAPLDQTGQWLVRCFDVKRVKANNHDWETATVALLVVVSAK